MTRTTSSDPLRYQTPLNVAFFHPDLGLGGAERLIADACISLQQVSLLLDQQNDETTTAAAGAQQENHANNSNNSSFSDQEPDTPVIVPSSSSNTFPPSSGSAAHPRNLPSQSQTTTPHHPHNSVTLYTSHHDPRRCFTETIDGTIKVFVEGNEWPRVFFGGIGHVLWAVWRMIWCVCRVMVAVRQQRDPHRFSADSNNNSTASNNTSTPTLPHSQISHEYQKRSLPIEMILSLMGILMTLLLFFWNIILSLWGRFVGIFSLSTELLPSKTLPKTASASDCPHSGYDVYIVDQVPIAIWLLKLFAPLKPNGEKPLILFYCHFPDKLLAQNRDSRNPLRRMYRTLFDWLEEWSMRQADVILVNSKFTRTVFKESFPLIRVTPQVLYPSLVEGAYDVIPQDYHKSILYSVYKKKHVIASINRFEKKKNHMLALEAFDELRHLLPDFEKKCHLVIAGGYDPRLSENVNVKCELEAKAKARNLQHQVTFVPSFSNADRYLLLHKSAAVVYTPQFEHFGIVPVEAMYCKRPVVAVNNGGPTESIAHGETGFLCEPNPKSFSQALAEILSDSEQARQIGEAGRERVKRMFSLQAFGKALNEYIRQEGSGRIGGSEKRKQD